MYSILHVEDDKDYAEVIQLHLHRCAQRAGESEIKFRTVESVDEASQTLESSTYDCIICDYQLPDGTGLDVVDSLRARECPCPIIFLTGQGDEQVARNAFVNGVNDYFSKDMGVAGYDKLFHSIMSQMRLSKLREHAVRATEALQEKERLVETFLDIAPVLIVTLDRDGCITQINKYGSEAFFDSGPIGTKLISHVPDDEAHKAVSSLDEAMCKGGKTPDACEFSLIDRQGMAHTMRWNMLPQVSPDGEVTGVLCFAQDLTDKAHAQHVLIQERNKFLSVLEALRIGVYIIDGRYAIEYANPEMRKHFGEPGSKKCYDYLHGRSTPCPECPNAKVFKGHIVVRERYYPRIDRKFSLTEVPLFNHDGSISKLELFYPE
jgi:PAS domain S-box-containing protein